jgi:hypothetical protein
VDGAGATAVPVLNAIHSGAVSALQRQTSAKLMEANQASTELLWKGLISFEVSGLVFVFQVGHLL